MLELFTPEKKSKALLTAPCAWAAAKAQGRSHTGNGTPCQDAIAVASLTDTNGNSWLIATIADGAGSSKHAETAAKLVVEHFVYSATELIMQGDGEYLHTLAKTSAAFARAIVLFKAYENGETFDDYLTTLLAVVTNGRETVMLQIGDGGIAIRQTENADQPAWRLAFEPHHGEWPGQTRFLTEPDAFDHLQTNVIKGGLKDIAIFSDGLEPLIVMPNLTIHAPFLDNFSSSLAASAPGQEALDVSNKLERILNGSVIKDRTNDDTSLVMLHFPA